MRQQLAGTELVFTQPFNAAERQVLPDKAIEFLTELVVKFSESRNQLLATRASWQQTIDQGALPDFILELIPFVMVIGKSKVFLLTYAIVELRSPGQ